MSIRSKTIIPTVLRIIRVIGIIVYFGKCGECYSGTSQTMSSINHEDSPFGLWDSVTNPVRRRSEAPAPDITSMTDLGVYWSAPCIPPFFPSNFTLWESYYNKYKNTGIKAVPMIDLDHVKDGGGFGLRPVEYYNSIKNAAAYFKDIDYWMLGVEVDILYDQEGVSPEQYALYIRLTYKALKDARTTAKLVTAGGGGITRPYNTGGFFPQVFDELEKMERLEKTPSSYDWSQNPYNLTQKEFDLVFAPDTYDKYMDAHHFSNFDVVDCRKYRKSTEELTQTIKSAFNKYGYNNIILWDTQTGQYAGLHLRPRIYHTEADQANALIRKYVLSLSLGVAKIFWTTTYEFNWTGNPQHYFSLVGLIYNGLGKDDLGYGVKKLSYYTYKKMVEKLEESDWNNIQAVINGTDNIYAYKFTKKTTGKPVWVVWWDYFDESGITSKSVTLSIGNINSVKITEAVPKYKTGNQVNNYADAFNIETKTASKGTVTVTLKQTPVFIESA